MADVGNIKTAQPARRLGLQKTARLLGVTFARLRARQKMTGIPDNRQHLRRPLSPPDPAEQIFYDRATGPPPRCPINKYVNEKPESRAGPEPPARQAEWLVSHLQRMFYVRLPEEGFLWLM